MDTRDVVIIGGGPAGSTAGWRLKKAGFQVALLDRAVFPRDKVCAGWITPAVIESLELDVEDYRRNRVFQTITGFQISLAAGAPLDIQYPGGVSYGIRRYEFDHYLLQRSGAELHPGEVLHSIRRDGKFWVLNEKWRTPLLIGAGGHHCPVARFLGKERGNQEQVVIAQEIEFAIHPDQEKEYRIEPQRPELYFCEDLKGYGWCFRKEGYLNIGMGREDRSHLLRHLADFVNELKRKKRIPSSAEYVFKGHSYLLNSRSRRSLTGEGVLLIGDSAGLAYTESGEGIRPAVESALFAVEAVLKAGGCFEQTRLAPYELKILRRFGVRGRESEPHPNRFKARLARFLISNRWFVDKILLDRWFLHRNQPPLLFKESAWV